MAHYAALSDYRFEEAADDIRGAALRDQFGDKIGKVQDVVFEHETGGIRYLIIDLGGSRRVLLPAERIFRSASDEDDFSTDLTKVQVAQLPAADETSIHTAGEPKAEEQRLQDAEKRAKEEYKNEYEDGPVAHREGSDRMITPEADEMPPAAGARQVSAADLTPHRLAGKFPGPSQPITSPTGIPGGSSGSPDMASRSTLTPAVVENAEKSSQVGMTRGPRWERFEQNLKRDLPKIREKCNLCSTKDRAA